MLKHISIINWGLTSAAPLYNICVMEQSSYKQATSDRLDMTFAALANPTRRAILARLASGEVSVSELAEPFSMSQPAISRHLKVLELAGFLLVGALALSVRMDHRFLDVGKLVSKPTN